MPAKPHHKPVGGILNPIITIFKEFESLDLHQFGERTDKKVKKIRSGKKRSLYKTEIQSMDIRFIFMPKNEKIQKTW